ncbi:(2Fe-2S) ferredoxin domain-containing protein [Nocardioides sp. WS12]|uniref:(2Fe-2S) ferredoxin domain-containing protein n=1 Tax=Nocardioides sp. WS12 TaxID=2486272 RepID=UPI0015FD25CC|nr:(2Fe-2S) ferredoxin domain-containing protein [Nocardioides sp. WS12]
MTGMTGPSTPLVLVAMAVDAAARDRELAELAEAVGATHAYLQGASPSLAAELDRLHAAGERRIRVTRVPVGGTAPARSWLTRVVAFWLTTHPDADVEIQGRDAQSQDTLTSPGWEAVPGHRHHVLVCRGPRCAARGSADTSAAIDAELRARGLGDDDVLVTQTGCMFPCNQAPVVVVQPDDRWFGRVHPDDVPALTDAFSDGTASPFELPRASRQRPAPGLSASSRSSP